MALLVITLASFEHLYSQRKKGDGSSSSTGLFWAQRARFDLLTSIPSLSCTTSYPPPKKKSPVPSEDSQFFLKPLVSVAQLHLATTNPPVINMAAGPWGTAFGPLNLAAALHGLLQSSRKNFPKFYGDGKQHLDEHIKAFYIAIGVFGVEHEDISIRLYIETLQGIAADWFYNLEHNSITD